MVQRAELTQRSRQQAEDTMEIQQMCTKLCQHKHHDLKDDVSEKQCPVTVNPRHMKNAFKVMNELRSQNLLCDVTLVAEDTEISAHRVVLAACSPYFHAMFTGEMSESKAKRVRIKEVDSWTLSILVDYVYTAELQVTEENVQVLCEAAFLLVNLADFLAPSLVCTLYMALAGEPAAEPREQMLPSQ
ncbi:kelch-like protein 2 [Rhincodon typus]|uniref:kelch-like protein 2 n=1 Tax=Rhincodon typus TaxID=259920 RepID=UPI00202DBC8C|nr:kelch-like protein 2 [Rhincodon typus]